MVKHTPKKNTPSKRKPARKSFKALDLIDGQMGHDKLFARKGEIIKLLPHQAEHLKNKIEVA